MTPPAAAASAAPRGRTAPARPLTRPARPGRVSGPAKRRAPSARPPQSARERGIALGLIAALSGVVQSSRLDRLIRGRGWIALVAFALIGIVTLQLGLLKLNSGMGRAIERAETLQRQNAALAIENSQLSAGSRVEALAAKMGMVVVPAGATRFLSTGSRGQAGAAAAALKPPSSTATAAAAPSGEASETPSSAAGTETPPGTQPQAAGASEATPEHAQPGEPTAASGGSQSASQPGTTSTSAPGAQSGPGEAAPAGGTQPGPAG